MGKDSRPARASKEYTARIVRISRQVEERAGQAEERAGQLMLGWGNGRREKATKGSAGAEPAYRGAREVIRYTIGCSTPPDIQWPPLNS